MAGQAATEGTLLHLLRTLPEQDAPSLQPRIRAGHNVSSIIRHAETGNLLLQISVTPESRFQYEFPSRVEMPAHCVPSTVDLQSLVFEAVIPYQSDQNNSRAAETIHPTLSTGSHHSMYLKTFHSAKVVDPLLYDATSSAWTSVSGDDVLVRDLLAYWFTCEYEFTSAIHRTHFIQDMATNRHDLCSSLLVNVIPAYCCVE